MEQGKVFMIFGPRVGRSSESGEGIRNVRVFSIDIVQGRVNVLFQ